MRAFYSFVLVLINIKYQQFNKVINTIHNLKINHNITGTVKHTVAYHGGLVGLNSNRPRTCHRVQNGYKSLVLYENRLSGTF